MKILVITTAAAVAMMSGGAFAQASYGTMTQSTEIVHSTPVVPDYKSTKQERIVDEHGNTIVKNQTVTNQGGATASSSTAKTISPDGAVTSQTTEQHTSTPLGETSSTSRTITTDR